MKVNGRAALALTELDNLLSLHNSFLSSTSFPCGSAGKESACSVGDLGWEDPLEKGKATLSSNLAWRIPGTVQSRGRKSWTQLRDFHFPLTTEFRTEQAY